MSVIKGKVKAVLRVGNAEIPVEDFKFEPGDFFRSFLGANKPEVRVEACRVCLKRPGLARAYGEAMCVECWRDEASHMSAQSCSTPGCAACSPDAEGPRVSALLARVDLSLFAMPLRVFARQYLMRNFTMVPHVTVEMLVPDREEPGRFLTLGISKAFKEYPSVDDEAAFLLALRRHATELILHEFDEAIVVDGLRRFDPHARPPMSDNPIFKEVQS